MKNHRVKPVRVKQHIPPPPDEEEGYDAMIAYHMRYPWEEIEKAGYAVEPSSEEREAMTASATYELLCRRGLQLKLSRRDYEQLSLIAAKLNVSAESIVKKWIRERLKQEAGQPAEKQR